MADNPFRDNSGFEADTDPGFTWLELEGVGKQQFPDQAVALWKARGWVPCDPPTVPSLTRDPLPEPEVAADEPAAEPASDEAAEAPKTTTRRSAGQTGKE